MDELGGVLSRRVADFSGRLRGAGLSADAHATMLFVRAIAELDALSIKDIYWAGRLSFVRNPEEIEIYEREFFLFARGEPEESLPQAEDALDPPRDLVAESTGSPEEIRDEPQSDSEEETAEVTLASSIELLRSKNFDRLTADEYERLKRLIASVALEPPVRLSRRMSAASRGSSLDLRKMLGASMKLGGEPAVRYWQKQQPKPRRMVFLFDVSGSMKGYSRTLLQFAYAVRRRQPRTEVFCFGTSLSRVTDLLRAPSVDVALAGFGERVPDWEGGTRLGDAIASFISGWGRRGVARGAVVIICSDGLERGDPEMLALQMRRLRGLAHAIVWVNPLKGSPGYEPLARGMAAALPYIDRFMSGHDLNSLEELAGALGDLRVRRAG
ncbi:MAG: VWA domain-containing protein [Actinobacteria bacterium]|nr:VWA domain-containing protein [Actinomycetota bacterium]